MWGGDSVDPFSPRIGHCSLIKIFASCAETASEHTSPSVNTTAKTWRDFGETQTRRQDCSNRCVVTDGFPHLREGRINTVGIFIEDPPSTRFWWITSRSPQIGLSLRPQGRIKLLHERRSVTHTHGRAISL